jgi:putative PIN family toxin of toxin-antitoxin system
MRRNNRIRIAVDVNIWIRTLLSPQFQIRSEVFFEPENLLLVSEELFEELDDTVSKPRLEKRIVRSEYDKLVFRLRTNAELVDVHSIVELCRDPDDDYLLALAKDGSADYLITDDNDLLVLDEFEKTKIVDLSEFENQK